MARSTDLLELEALVPWSDAGFRDGLAALRSSAVEQAQRYARDVQVLAELARQVPRCAFDDRGATPWTSFLREVAVAAQVGDRTAAFRVRAALRLTSCLPTVLTALVEGTATVQRAEAFVREVEPYDDELAAALDRQVGPRAGGLSPGRIVHEVRRAAARLDAEAAAARTAVKDRDRGVVLRPDADDQATLTVFGPAVPLVRAYADLDDRARALKAAGDPRTLDQLRFDLATTTGCQVHAPTTAADLPDVVTAPTTAAEPTAGTTAATAVTAATAAQATTATDRRCSRPMQATITVPVETALGLSNEPGWLDGYGWLSAPACRGLLVDAELRRVCVQSGTGQPVTADRGLVRPDPTPAGVRAALLDMVLTDLDLPPDDPGWTVEPQHDPSAALARFVRLRDRVCDGPTQTWVPAARADLDHDIRWPDGPTAAWNLVARGRRSHLLKHYGWTALRTAGSTLWCSPSGQLVEVPYLTAPPPGVDTDHDGHLVGPVLPDPQQLAETDARSLSPPDDEPPWLRADQHPEPGDWHWLTG